MKKKASGASTAPRRGRNARKSGPTPSLRASGNDQFRERKGRGEVSTSPPGRVVADLATALTQESPANPQTQIRIPKGYGHLSNRKRAPETVLRSLPYQHHWRPLQEMH